MCSYSVSLTAMAPLRENVVLTKPVLHSLNGLFTVYQLIFFSVDKSSQISVGDQAEKRQAALLLRFFALEGVTALFTCSNQSEQQVEQCTHSVFRLTGKPYDIEYRFNAII